VNQPQLKLVNLPAEARFRQPESVQAYRLGRLIVVVELAARNRHLAWCVALAEKAELDIRQLDNGLWAHLRAPTRWPRSSCSSVVAEHLTRDKPGEAIGLDFARHSRAWFSVW
jgi:hypothetical protein